MGGSTAASAATGQIAGAVEQAAGSRPLGLLARLGLVARGAVYLLIGILGLVLASGRPAEADQAGALHALMGWPFGWVAVALCGLGFLGYAIWRFAEAATGVVADGDSLGARLRSLGRGLIYLGLAGTSLLILLGARVSQGQQEQSLTSRALAWPGGRILVGLVGVAVLALGIGLIVEGARHKFLRYLDHSELSPGGRRFVTLLGTVGSIARGIVVALVGLVLIGAAWFEDEKDARGIDGALEWLRGLPAGDLVLVLLSLGLITFGVYGLLEARYRRVGTAGNEA